MLTSGILMVSVDALPNMGGISTMTHHLANAFQMRGHETFLLAPKGSYIPQGYDALYRLIEDYDARPRHREHGQGAGEDERIRDLVLNVLERYRCDVVFLMHPFYYGYGVLEAAKRLSIPVSVAIHGLEWKSQTRDLTASEVQSTLALPHHRSLREKLVYVVAQASQVVANSNFTAGLLADVRPLSTITVAGCGLDQGRILHELEITPCYDAAEKQERRRRLGIGGRKCLVYVGRLVVAKAVHRILLLCAARADVSAIIVGDGPDRERLEELAKRKGVADRVHFIGKADEEEKWQYLRAADAVCLLSVPNERSGNVEGFGIALLEGAAAGCVPISSGAGGMVDVVQDRETGLIMDNNTPPTIAAILDALDDVEFTSRLVQNARAQLQSRFSWDAVLSRIESEWAK